MLQPKLCVPVHDPGVQSPRFELPLRALLLHGPLLHVHSGSFLRLQTPAASAPQGAGVPPLAFGTAALAASLPPPPASVSPLLLHLCRAGSPPSVHLLQEAC